MNEDRARMQKKARNRYLYLLTLALGALDLCLSRPSWRPRTGRSVTKWDAEESSGAMLVHDDAERAGVFRVDGEVVFIT